MCPAHHPSPLRTGAIKCGRVVENKALQPLLIPTTAGGRTAIAERVIDITELQEMK